MYLQEVSVLDKFEPDMFSRRLKALREERGMDQDELAKASGISKGSIARYETEKSIPGADVIYALSRALDCSSDVLLCVGPLTGVA